ncbi:hypothetical protein D9M72_600410 [compost metagenome]
MARPHCAQQRQRERHRRRSRRKAHRHLARDALPGRLHVDLRLLALAQDDLSMAVQHFPRFGRRHAALGAHQQLLPHLALQRGQLLTQRRLGNEKNLGGLCQAADVHDLHEVFKSTQVHARIRSKSRA